jgi:hypothetical protein
MTPPFRELDTVVLVHDLPDAGLHSGEVGAVVHVYAPDALEVEFVTSAGTTAALLTLSAHDVRIARDDEVIAPHPVGGG